QSPDSSMELAWRGTRAFRGRSVWRRWARWRSSRTARLRFACTWRMIRWPAYQPMTHRSSGGYSSADEPRAHDVRGTDGPRAAVRGKDAGDGHGAQVHGWRLARRAVPVLHARFEWLQPDRW